MKPTSLKLFDLHRQYLALKPEIDGAIANVLESTAFIKGPEVAAFEKAFATYLGVEHVVTCGSGTDALQIAYMALGIGPGDEVITTPFSFVATVEAMVVLGATPVFVDIDPRTYNIDVARLGAAITEKTKAIVPVHLYGQPADMAPLLQIARANNVPVIEDTAQATGATYQGQIAGTMGDMGCFSFFPAKNLGCFGDGGAIATNSGSLAERCRLIANHGSKQRYHHDVVGINSRLDTLQAAILLAKLPHLEAMNQQRIKVAARYDSAFADLPIKTPFVAQGMRHVYQQYTIRTPQRGALVRHLQEAGVPFAIHYPQPLHKQPAYRAALVDAQYTEAETAAAEVLSLPMFPEISDFELEAIIAGVTRFAK